MRQPGQSPRARRMLDPVPVVLRPRTNGDLDRFFHWERDPRVVHMAAFTRTGPSDRAGFDAKYELVGTDPSATLFAIDADGELVGTVASFTMGGERNVSYWICPARWGERWASGG